MCSDQDFPKGNKDNSRDQEVCLSVMHFSVFPAKVGVNDYGFLSWPNHLQQFCYGNISDTISHRFIYDDLKFWKLDDKPYRRTNEVGKKMIEDF